MRTFTYRIERHPGIRVTLQAESPRAAAVIASEFGTKHGLLLIGPVELADEPVYR